MLAILALLTACAPAEDGSSRIYRLPWLDSKGEYSFQDVELTSFDEPDKLRGSVAEIIISPRISESSVVSEEPIGRWIRDGNRMRPADSTTEHAATIYAHLEKLADIDKTVGLGLENRKRARVGLLAQISASSTSPILYNNAIYDGRLDTLFIVPFTGDLLPISLNAGIIAHEHFHRIFQPNVLNKIRGHLGSESSEKDSSIQSVCIGGSTEHKSFPTLPDGASLLAFTKSENLVPSKILNQTLIRGLNEGFADFWGWAYSRDEFFVSRSLGVREQTVRRLDKPVDQFPQKNEFRNSLVTVNSNGQPVLKSEGGRIGASYLIGTQFARILRGTVEALVNEGKMDRKSAIDSTRAALAGSLNALATELSKSNLSSELEPEILLKPFFTRLVRMTGDGPATLKAESATALCRELLRLRASDTMLSGLCSREMSAEASPSSPQ